MSDFFGWFAALTSGLRALPQSLRLRRSTTAHGLSAESMAFTGINGVAWMIWSWDADLLSVFASSSVTALGFLWIAWRIRHESTQHFNRLLVLSAATYGLVWTTFGPEGLGYAGAIGSTVQFLPQAYKTFRSTNLSDVSPGTYLLASLNEASWLTYAALTVEPLIGIAYVVRLPTSLYILISVLRSHPDGDET